MTVPTIRCPLCDWTYTVPPLPAGIDEHTLESVFGRGVMKVQAIHQRVAERECILREHLDTHPLPAWVRKVTALQAQIEQLKAELAMLREKEAT